MTFQGHARDVWDVYTPGNVPSDGSEMANDRLRDALERARVSPMELAICTESDVKTVSRWLGGRVPHPRTRLRIAKRLKEDEDYLWPGARKSESNHGGSSGVVQIYDNRALIPVTLWDRLFENATTEIGILVYVGMFLTEKALLPDLLRRKSRGGTRVRIMLGEPGSDALALRSLEEGIGRDTISAKVSHALSFFRPVVGNSEVKLRTHRTTLYNSIYIFDDNMIVNPHIFGKTAPHAPAFHLRRTTTPGMYEAYRDSFDAIWDEASPVDDEE